MWMTIIVVLGADPVFQGTASPLSGHIGAGVYEARAQCESDLMRYFQTFDGEGESPDRPLGPQPAPRTRQPRAPKTTPKM